MREDRRGSEPGSSESPSKPKTVIPLLETTNGRFEIDMAVIRSLGKKFDEGCETEDCIIARFILAAYDAGYEAGMTDAEDSHQRLALLLTCTAGNA